ncbi:MAG TPA: hypothetical protein PKE04_20980, partial [Clostridia bacterium]|nr:hypothetical protein [Clostridia bacterium]
KREKGEKALLTGEKMREHPSARANPSAHKHFLRLHNLLEKINHADALYENVVNRYCLTLAEIERTEAERTELDNEQGLLIIKLNDGKLEADDYFDHLHRLLDKKLRMDITVDRKRSMLLAIEKEMAMTVAAALRCVPRKDSEDDGAEDPMLTLLNRRGGAGV